MYQHHQESLDNMIQYFKEKEGVIALIFGGSVAKGTERPDSDLDAVVIVTEELYLKQKKEKHLVEVIEGHCTYEGGYFDVKYKTKDFLKLAAAYGSEPTRASFDKAKVLFSSDPEIEELLAAIHAFPLAQREEKRRVLYANVWLNQNYFMWCLPKKGRYMQFHVVSELVYSIYRLILEENEVLFPCSRRLEEYVELCEHKPAQILELAEAFMDHTDHETCKAFVQAFLDWTKLPILMDMNEILSTYTKAYEEWWMEDRAPFVNEW